MAGAAPQRETPEGWWFFGILAAFEAAGIYAFCFYLLCWTDLDEERITMSGSCWTRSAWWADVTAVLALRVPSSMTLGLRVTTIDGRQTDFYLPYREALGSLWVINLRFPPKPPPA